MDKLQSIEDKIDKLDARFNDMCITLAKQSVILEMHVKRTNLLEESLKPIETHVGLVNSGIKILTAVSFLTGLILSVLKLLKML